MQFARLTMLAIFISSRWPSMGRLLVLLLSLSGSWALSGCAFLTPRDDPTRFYVLTAPTAQAGHQTEGAFKRWKLGLRPVEVPAYLRSKAMVVRTGTNELRFADFDSWGEPIEAGISRVLAETLMRAQNVESVAVNSHGDTTLDYEVTIRMLACEGVTFEHGDSSIRFALTWELRSFEKNSTVTNRGVFRAEPSAWDGKDYGHLAERLSEAITGASQAIAEGLPMDARTPGKENNDGTNRTMKITTQLPQ